MRTASSVLIAKYSSGDHLREARWTGHVERMGKRRDAYRVLVGRPQGKRSLGRHRCRWKDNIKIELGEVRWGSWTGLLWLRMAGACKCGNETIGFHKLRRIV